MTTDAEAVVRRAYHLAEGNVMDVRGFMDLFADDGMLNAGGQSYRGEHLADRRKRRRTDFEPPDESGFVVSHVRHSYSG